LLTQPLAPQKQPSPPTKPPSLPPLPPPPPPLPPRCSTICNWAQAVICDFPLLAPLLTFVNMHGRIKQGTRSMSPEFAASIIQTTSMLMSQRSLLPTSSNHQSHSLQGATTKLIPQSKSCRLNNHRRSGRFCGCEETSP
jgi:hypothetical protein